MSSLLLQGLYASSISTFHWVFIVLLGIIANRKGFVDKKFKNGLSKLVTNIILPCFIFTQILNNFRIYQYMIIFQSVIGVLIIYVLGLLIGFTFGKIYGLTKKQHDFIGVVCSSPHNTSIYVILIQVIGPFMDQIIPRPKNLVGDSEKRGLLYVVINSIASNIWKWSVCYMLIEPEDENEDEMDTIDTPLLRGSENDNNQLVEKKPKYQEKNIFKSIVNMPLITSMFTLLLTCYPALQRAFITPKSFLRETILKVNMTVSKAYSFIVIFMLGLSIAENVNCFKTKESDKKTKESFMTSPMIFWLCLVKLVVMPLIFTPIILYVFRRILYADDVMTFNMLFLGAAPSAINIIVICTFKNAFVNEISSIMIAMYTTSIVTLTVSIAIFLYILGSLNAPLMGVNVV